MSWHVEARGKKLKALDFCVKQKHFVENAPVGVKTALKELASYFPDNAIVSIVCNGHLAGEGGNVKIEIQNISSWVE